ncbi:MAG: translation elongation factor-like protein [Candidatus Omnitrophica bacterium]|nr:translation elongation factor-like protein [Candidatus Omnitrophota bacterium]MDD5574465.1 translation elongation factor-like protein [Candidatus Omnitrophota bacterium]
MHRASRPSKTAKSHAKTPWIPAGEISHYFPKVKAAVFKCRVPLAIGDAVWIKGKNTNFRQTVGSMQIDRKPIERASKGQEIGLGVLRDVCEGDGIYLAKT